VRDVRIAEAADQVDISSPGIDGGGYILGRRILRRAWHPMPPCNLRGGHMT